MTDQFEPDSGRPNPREVSNEEDVRLEELHGQLELPAIAEDEPPPNIPTQEFLIPVHQFVAFTEREVALIDHPAFQRLFVIQQLGQTDLVFRGATHRRGEHALGTVASVAALIEAIARNSPQPPAHVGANEWRIGAQLTQDEEAFARAAALLHDVGHIAAGHTLEDELGLLEPHDGGGRLGFVLDRARWGGRTIPEGPINETLRQRIDRLYEREARRVGLRIDDGLQMSASDVLVQLISSDGPAAGCRSATMFRINVIRDLVGNTICADLLDYLHRDWQHIGKPRFLDTRLLQYFELRDRGEESQVAVNLQSNKPGRYRPDAVTAILDLLESRYQLWEVALLHRTKTGAASMLERAIAELAEGLEYFSDEATAQAVAGALLEALFESTDEDMYRVLSELDAVPGVRDQLGREVTVPAVTRDLLWRLRYRILHKQVEVVGAHDTHHGRTISERLAPWKADRARRLEAAMHRLMSLRELELDFGFEAGSLSMYCAPYGMGGKLAEVRVLHRGQVRPLHEADEHGELSGGHLAAQLQRFDRLWRAALFVSPERVAWLDDHELTDALALAFQKGVLGMSDSATSMRNVAEALAARAGSPHFGRRLRSNELVGAREGVGSSYPSGAPTARAYFE